MCIKCDIYFWEKSKICLSNKNDIVPTLSVMIGVLFDKYWYYP